MANEPPAKPSPFSAVQVWTDPRLLFMWIMPLGTLVWLGGTVFLAIFPFVYFQRELPELENKIAFAVASFLEYWLVRTTSSPPTKSCSSNSASVSSPGG